MSTIMSKPNLTSRQKAQQMQDDAAKQTVTNGHKMTTWRISRYGADFICHCHCTRCFSGVMIDTRLDDPTTGSALRQDCDPDQIPF